MVLQCLPVYYVVLILSLSLPPHLSHTHSQTHTHFLSLTHTHYSPTPHTPHTPPIPQPSSPCLTEEEKAQADRYKQLLLKQRDIMIALTQRLVERDEQIMALQDELDAYDRRHKELEEKLDEKTASLIK